MFVWLFLLLVLDRDEVEIEDDSNEDNEDSSSAEEDEDTKMPPKQKKTPTKPKPEAPTTVDFATKAMSTMSVAGFKSWSMDFEFPYMIKSFMHNNRKGCIVEFLVLTVSEDIVRCSVDPGGLVLSFGLVVPEFFPEEERVLVSNMGVAGFDQNTSQFTAHSHVVQDIRKVYSAKPEIIGKPQKIKLPFQCELDILHQELQLFNGDELVSAGAGSQQYFSLLKVDLLAIERTTAKKARAGMRVVGSANLADH